MYRVTVEWPAFDGSLVYELDTPWVEVDTRNSSINYEKDFEVADIPIEGIYDARVVIEKL